MIRAATAFSGAGLSAYALKKNIGCRLVFGIEHDSQIADAYSLNFPNSIMLEMSVQEAATKWSDRIIGYAPPGELDIFQASPSCKKFAQVNTGNDPDQDDELACLGLAKLISTLEPKTIVI